MVTPTRIPPSAGLVFERRHESGLGGTGFASSPAGRRPTMKLSGDERMERAERHFQRLASGNPGPIDTETYEHLRRMAETVQESLRLIEHLKLQVEDLRHKVAVP
jgi:hypothetical protein